MTIAPDPHWSRFLSYRGRRAEAPLSQPGSLSGLRTTAFRRRRLPAQAPGADKEPIPSSTNRNASRAADAFARSHIAKLSSSRALVDDRVCVRLGWHPCGPDGWLGCLVWKKLRKTARGRRLRAKCSSMNGRRPRTQFARLVVHADCDAADLLFVLTRVMGAEQQLTARPRAQFVGRPGRRSGRTGRGL
jgi:hypothetical protein